MPLADAKIKVTPVDGGRSLTLTTDAPAFFVWLDAKDAKGRFGDNCFTLLPGRPATVALPDGLDRVPDFVPWHGEGRHDH